MGWKRGLGYVVGGLLVVLIGAVLIGQLFGVPVLLGFVETGSMSPTLEPGDGFVAIPAEVAGPVEEGDVITFEAKELHGGGLTTHRAVGETEHGYVTKGDANPFVDQDGSEPYVTDGQVVAKALQVNGEVVVIPHLGTAVTGVGDGVESFQWWLAGLLGTTAVLGTQGLAYVAFALGAIVLLTAALEDRGRREHRSRERRRTRPGVYDGRRVVAALAIFLLVVTAGTMLAASGSSEFGIVSAEFDSDRPDVIPKGETDLQEYALGTESALPMLVVLEPASDGVAIEEPVHRVERGETVNATVAYTAPPETGYYLRSVSEYRYFAVLPTGAILSLHAIHPWLAISATTVTVVAPIAIALALLAGTGPIRTRERRRKSTKGYL